MNHLIVLPGNSPKNEVWGSVCADHFASEFDAVTVQSYTHWQSGEPVIDFEVEKATLAATVEASPEATWFAFAKSAGTILALEAVAAGIITPKQCVFFGMPLDLAAEDLYSEDWSSLDITRVTRLPSFVPNNVIEVQFDRLSDSIHFLSFERCPVLTLN